eukprot:m.432185 g.432185  ORF g.432185 m.432185 type:complete len:107 (+) comp21407_c0_seq39:1524-1844(+)
MRNTLAAEWRKAQCQALPGCARMRLRGSLGRSTREVVLWVITSHVQRRDIIAHGYSDGGASAHACTKYSSFERCATAITPLEFLVCECSRTHRGSTCGMSILRPTS